MKHVKLLYEALLNEQDKHSEERFNYTIPQAWNMFGFQGGKATKSKELIVSPYDFYTFQLGEILKLPTCKRVKDKEWIKKSTLYYHITSTCGSWDHDRDDSIQVHNLYGLQDTGTFLKSIILLPLYKRMGMTTILMDMPVDILDHNPEAILSYENLHNELKDDLVSIDVISQCQAFIDTAHHLGMQVIWSCNFASVSTHNELIFKHPEWFYWISSEYKDDYHSPVCAALPDFTIPKTDILPIFYKSEDVQQHLTMFQKAPKPAKSLAEIETSYNVTIASAIHDLINSKQEVSKSTTTYRFFKDHHHLTQDVLRCDLHPGEQVNQDLWTYLIHQLEAMITIYHLDGIMFTHSYLMPTALLQQMVTSCKKMKSNFVSIIEENDDNLYDSIQVDAYSGNACYVEHSSEHHSLHDYVYNLQNRTRLSFAACEYLDTPRISAHPQGATLATLLHTINLFLPNSIPLYISGMECGEQQPINLSIFADQTYANCVSKEDNRYRKQALRNRTYFEYRQATMYQLPKLLEQLSDIRNTYIDAIIDPTLCMPVWFTSPSIDALGFAYTLENKCLLMIANTNTSYGSDIYALTQNIMHHLPFSYSAIRQVYSTHDPFTYEIQLDNNQNLGLYYLPGEVKFFEIT